MTANGSRAKLDGRTYDAFPERLPAPSPELAQRAALLAEVDTKAQVK